MKRFVSVVALFALTACHDTVAPDLNSEQLDPLASPDFHLKAYEKVVSKICIVPPEGLTGWWTGDEDASDNANIFDGVLMNGAMAGVKGLVDGAFEFDGVDDYVTFPGISFPAGTLDFWMKTRVAGQSVMDGGSQTEFTSWRFEIADDGSPVLLYFSNDLAEYVPFVGSTDVADGKFRHIAIQREDDAIRLFVDGELEASRDEDLGWAGTGTGDAQVGLSDVAVLPGPLYYEGLIDELELFGRILSADEIASIYDAGKAGKCKTEAEVRVLGLIKQIYELHEAGELREKYAKHLVKKLEKVMKELAKDKSKKAIKELRKFVDRVEKAMKKGGLAPAIGQAMIEEAELLMELL